MKNLFLYIIGFAVLIASCKKSLTAQNVSLKKNGTSKQVLKTPESVCYDMQRDILYVSNINGDPAAKDGNGFISQMNKSGQIEKLNWITGLNAPKGMGIYGNNLYVTDIDNVVLIDINKGEIRKKIFIPEAQFLNDIAIDSDGNLYVSDMLGNKIYKISGEKYFLWLGNGLNSPNGMFISGNNLFVGNSGYLLRVNLQNKQTATLHKNTGIIDGLKMDKYGNFFITDWLGNISLLSKNGKKTLKKAQEGINAADIEIIGNKMYVPTFSDNRIEIYQIDYQ